MKSNRRMTRLPRRHKFAHEFAFALHDWMVGHLLRGERERLFEVSVTGLSADELAELERLQADAVIDWLERRGRHDAVDAVYMSRAFSGLLSDLLHFLYEALSCSRKGKLAVAFALLRKPLRENLTYLEWMLAEPDEFLAALKQGGPNALSLQRLSVRAEAVHESARRSRRRRFRACTAPRRCMDFDSTSMRTMG